MSKRRLLIAIIIFPLFCLGQTRRLQGQGSDEIATQQEIKNAVINWLRKGEFEKSDTYKSRVKNELATAFDSICFSVVRAAIREKYSVQFELLSYHADTEKFGARFHTGNNSWTDSLPIPLEKAPRFKETASFIVPLADAKEWVFVNGFLQPVKVRIISPQGSFLFHLSTANSKKIQFTSAQLGVAALQDQNLRFDYAAYAAKAPQAIGEGDGIGDGGIDPPTRQAMVFEKVEIEPSVNIAQWRRHLESQLYRYVEDAASAGMPPGNYTVNVRFIVETDGSVSNVWILNNPGYGLAKGAIEIVRRGPRWSPGEQNGRKVRAYHIQPITFQIQEK